MFMKTAEALLSVKFNTSLKTQELNELCQADLEYFRSVRGLVQKYYILDSATGTVNGIYLFETKFKVFLENNRFFLHFDIEETLKTSETISSARLSSRNSLNDACRIMRSAVQPANSLSATSSGVTYRTFDALRGAVPPPNGLLSPSVLEF